MVRQELIATKLGELSERLARVSEHCPDTAQKLKADADARELVAFNLMLAVQSCVDIASHIVSDEGWTPIPTLKQAFETIHKHGVISASSCDALSLAVGLRNLIAHGYAEVDTYRLFDAATKGIVQLGLFAQEVSQWAIKQT